MSCEDPTTGDFPKIPQGLEDDQGRRSPGKWSSSKWRRSERSRSERSRRKAGSGGRGAAGGIARGRGLGTSVLGGWQQGPRPSGFNTENTGANGYPNDLVVLLLKHALSWWTHRNLWEKQSIIREMPLRTGKFDIYTSWRIECARKDEICKIKATHMTRLVCALWVVWQEDGEDSWSWLLNRRAKWRDGKSGKRFPEPRVHESFFVHFLSLPPGLFAVLTRSLHSSFTQWMELIPACRWLPGIRSTDRWPHSSTASRWTNLAHALRMVSHVTTATPHRAPWPWQNWMSAFLKNVFFQEVTITSNPWPSLFRSAKLWILIRTSETRNYIVGWFWMFELTSGQTLSSNLPCYAKACAISCPAATVFRNYFVSGPRMVRGWSFRFWLPFLNFFF